MVRSITFYYTLVFCAIISISCACFGSDEELFLRGNNYYNQKNYEKALDSYRMMNKKGRAVFYNMGNCFFHQQEYAQALVHWSRAQHGATVSEYKLIEENKQKALKKIGKDAAQQALVSVSNQLYAVALYPSLFLLQLLFLFFWCVFLFAFSKKQSGTYKVLQGSAFVSFLLVFTVLIVQSRALQSSSAIVVKKDVALLNGPDTTFQIIAPVSYAENVQVKETRKGWCKVQYAGMIGWIAQDSIQII